MNKPFLIFFLLCWQSLQAQVINRNLSDLAWTCSNSRYPDFKAKVPGNVHTDLFRNHLIKDPFYGENEKELQWIENENWNYKTYFTVSKIDFSNEHVELIFEGLDTYATVLLNDSIILQADNMFREWEIDVKQNIKIGINKLEVRFESASKKGKAIANLEKIKLPGNEAVYTRKSPYHYGWDWGPRFVTCGIWKPVFLRLWKDSRIENIQYVLDGLSDSLATIHFIINMEGEVREGTEVSVEISDYKLVQSFVQKLGNEKSITIPLKIRNPKKWWCHGWGQPFLYKAQFKLSNRNGMIDMHSLQLGIRKLELVQEKDSIGSSFYFRLNDKPIYAKGANIIPSEFFLPEISRNKEEQLLKQALEANMNMLRVWGGGQYATDDFYQLCDSLGIMVWQDFMFACAMYPGTRDFLSNVSEELNQQIIRLRNHPSLALWCGNNEMEEGWNNWGWQKQLKYTAADSIEVFQYYKNLFHAFIPNALLKLDAGRAYHPSSPANGWGRDISLKTGDLHYWGVWWGMEPFEKYSEKVGRFVSEFGFQGMPELSSMRKYIPTNELQLGSASMKNHQKHPTGYETIRQYMERDYPYPDGLNKYNYISQLMQAEGVCRGVEAQRRSKPYCMGTLYWQLNDCWPVTSWSSIDYYGKPKALHYALKNTYAPYLISPMQEKDSINIRIISDDTISMNQAMLITEIMTFKGKLLYSDSLNVNINNTSFTQVLAIRSEILEQLEIDSTEIVISFRLFQNNSRSGDKRLLANKLHFLKKPKELQLEKPEISIQAAGDENKFYVKNRGGLVKNIQLSIGDAIFSDNFFDLLPGESRLISIRNNKDNIRVQDISVQSLFDCQIQ